MKISKLNDYSLYHRYFSLSNNCSKDLSWGYGLGDLLIALLILSLSLSFIVSSQQQALLMCQFSYHKSLEILQSTYNPTS